MFRKRFSSLAVTCTGVRSPDPKRQAPDPRQPPQSVVELDAETVQVALGDLRLLVTVTKGREIEVRLPHRRGHAQRPVRVDSTADGVSLSVKL